MKDEVRIYLDTTGTGLHKRGYRPAQVAAPLRGDAGRRDGGHRRLPRPRRLLRPLLRQRHDSHRGRPRRQGPRAGHKPRLRRRRNGPASAGTSGTTSARPPGPRNINGDYRIFASDIDPRAVELARANARRAGVEELIDFSVGGRAGVFPRHGAGRHRHEPALRRAADGKARGRAALRATSAGRSPGSPAGTSTCSAPTRSSSAASAAPPTNGAGSTTA